MDIKTCNWSPQLLKEFNIPISCLPQIKSSSEIYGYWRLADNIKIPVCGCSGDQQAAFIGHGLFTEGDVKCTYGTGAFILMNTGDTPVQSKTGLITTVCYQLGVAAPIVYGLEGSIASAGGAITWLIDNLKVIEHPRDTEALVKSVESCNGVRL